MMEFGAIRKQIKEGEERAWVWQAAAS